MASGTIKTNKTLSGQISTTKTTSVSVSHGGGGTADHERLINRSAEDSHPIEAITDLEETLSTLDKNIKKRAKGLYFDLTSELDTKPYWYITSEIDPSTGLGTKNSIISGPYDLGLGGGSGSGGSSITEVSLTNIDTNTGISYWPKTVSLDSECNIKINWSSVKNDRPTGNGNIYLYVNNKLISNKVYPQGEVEFEISKYLNSGDNKIEIKVVDVYSGSAVLIDNITAVSLSLQSSFDGKRVFTDFTEDRITYYYVPVGDLEKRVHFILDDTEINSEIVRTSNEQKTFLLPHLSHGSHKLEVYFSCVIDGSTVNSNKKEYQLLCVEANNQNVIIATDFNQLEQEQYVSFNLPYRVYTPGHNDSEVKFIVDGEIKKEVTVDQSEHFFDCLFDVVGDHTLEIKSGNISKTFNIRVNASRVTVQAVSDNLVLGLSTQGRSNDEALETRQQWIDTKNNIRCNLTNFNWSSDGWVMDENQNTVLRISGDARVEIPYKPFRYDFKQLGKTIEIEFATKNVRDYSSTLISCFDATDNKNIGFYLTSQEAEIKSEQKTLSTQYKEEDHVRVSFVVEKATESRIIYMYINGVICGATVYPESDRFNQLTPQNIILGSNDATLDIYNIRVYDNDLNRKQMVNNWIADTQNSTLRAERFYQNDNYNELGQIVIDKLPSTLPYVVWDIDPLPQFKGDKKPGKIEYYDPKDELRRFTASNVEYNVQGTSSSVYPVKNIRAKHKDKGQEFVLEDGSKVSGFAITEDGFPINYFTYKVDYASSEGANNVELVRLYDDLTRAYDYLNPAQKLDERVRSGIDGYPIAAFHKTTDGKVSFLTKANMNNDKANEEVYGFIDGDESWETTNNTAEVANYTKAVDINNFTEGFEIRYPDEDDYGKTASQISKLLAMSSWVVSTDPTKATGNQLSNPIAFTYSTSSLSEDSTYKTKTITTETFTHDTAEYRKNKFKAELGNHFDINSTIFYYLFTHLFLMVDSRAKNAFPTYFVSRQAGDGGNKWFWLPYDMDTALGINNEGKLVFDYSLEDIDKVDGANVFNGQESVLWTNLREMFDGEIGAMYSTLRASGSILSFDNVENRFEQHQNQWSASIFNEDSYNKYIKTYIEEGKDYLEMLQGSKAEQRRWWLYNRFKYFDSKYLVGDAKSDVIQFRAYAETGQEKPDITITPYADIYATVSFSNTEVAIKTKRAKRNEAITLENPFSLEASETDQETYIYSASQIKSLSDLSGFHPGTMDVSNAIRLQELKIGDASETYRNEHLTSLTLGNNTLLRSLDVRNCTNLTNPINIENCTNIEEVYFDGTRITGITLPNGGTLKHLHLPETITNLKIRNHPLLTDLQLAGTSNISSLWLENIPATAIDPVSFVRSMPSNSEIRLIGINLNVTDKTIGEKTITATEQIMSFYDDLDRMRGIDVSGATLDTCKTSVTGSIKIRDINYADYASFKERYPDINIISNNIQCTVSFYNDLDHTTSDNDKFVRSGQTILTQHTITNPEKAPTKQYFYTFKGWSTSKETYEAFDLNSIVTTDLKLYAHFNQYVQKYNVVFEKGSDSQDIRLIKNGSAWSIPLEFTLDYGTILSYDIISDIVSLHGIRAESTSDSLIFIGWQYQEGSEANWKSINSSITVKDNLKFVARWSDLEKPVGVLSIKDHNTFICELKDNLGATHYALTNELEAPEADSSKWIEVENILQNNVVEKEIDNHGLYYLHVRDTESVNLDPPSLRAYSISKQVAEGIELNIIDLLALNSYLNNKEVNDFAIDGSQIRITYNLDDHYENLTVKLNNNSIESGYEHEVTSDIFIEASCTPKSYTVSFNTNNRGDEVENQVIVYNNLAIKPQAQFIQTDYNNGEIIEGWYLEDTYITKFDFDIDTIDRDLVLYAKWVEYSEPTILKINIIEPNTQITVNYRQEALSGVSINFGDQAIINSTDYNVSVSHIYSETGEYSISITRLSGSYYLGKDINNQAVMPIENLIDVEFANDVAYTLEYAFKGATNLTDLKLTDYMSKITQGAFQNCIGLTALKLSRNVREIGISAFAGCENIRGDLEIPYLCEIIDDYAFDSCSNISSLNLNKAPKLETLGQYAFRSCNNLETLNIPNSVNVIHDWCFSSCNNLTTVDIDLGVEELKQSVFVGCQNLETIYLRNKDLIIGQNCFANCIKLKTAGPIIDGQNYNIQFAWDETIPDRAFFVGVDQGYIESIILPNTLKQIGENAFESQQNVASIILPNTLERIGAAAFARMNSLTTLIIPGNVTHIGDMCFAYSSIKQLYLYNSSSSNRINEASRSWVVSCSNINIHVLASLENYVNTQYAYGQFWNYIYSGTTAQITYDLY